MSGRRRKSALVFVLPGLGDALSVSPIVEALLADGYELDALTMLSAVTEYLVATERFREVHEVPFLRRWNGRTFAAIARAIWRRRYEALVLPFPATRWQYALVAALARGRRLYAHDYGGAATALLRVRGATLVPLRGGHRVCENARLAAEIVGENGESAQPYLVPAAWRSERVRNVLGIQPGSMAYKGNEARRWPLERFIELALRASERGRTVRFFLGPYERDLAALLPANVEPVCLPLPQAARSIASCEVFVGNDGGMTHLAAALGTKTVAIYTMTSAVRGAVLGRTIVVQQHACPPCYDEGLPRFDCVLRIGHMCTTQISVDDVDTAVERAFAGDVPEIGPQRESPFRLYGVERA